MGFKAALSCHPRYHHHLMLFIFMSLVIPDLSSDSIPIPSGLSATNSEASPQTEDSSGSFSTKHRFHSTLKDITNPVTTIPTIIPAPYSGSASTSSSATASPPSSNPVIIPTSNPGAEVSPQTMAANPVGYPAGSYSLTNPPPSLSGSWCIASQGASRAALQVGLDFACGYGRADCSAIQPGGRCYEPNSVRDHASYAFNEYYQKNPIPSSCNFGGTALVTSTDPSSSTCRYQSTSTSSSILNTTNSVGSRVFGGAVPTGPTTTSSPARRLVASASFLGSLVIILTLTRLDQLCL
ncbi:hypothetical protein MLD38_003143 [Melastoma candidum]|uniref:Uncharacterized protein n=1 Tax=Melastoma candidum TaxID=119954 RepID=A0ACB9S0W0_9MYRT|nr:hypothetical protein MLD38_003143 [Melastoma candidum]